MEDAEKRGVRAGRKPRKKALARAQTGLRRREGLTSGTSGTSGNGMFGKMMLVFGCIGTDFCK